MMKKSFVYIILLASLHAFAQSKQTADRYFNEYAYVKAAELYEKIVAKGDGSKEVLSNLADAYYFNVKTDKAAFWYKKLFNLYEQEGLNPEYYYRYAQSLKATKEYKLADSWMLKFEKKKKNDSRGKKLLKNKNYVEDFTKADKEVVIKNLLINTPYSDFGAFQNDKEMYFSSTRPASVTKEKALYAWNKQPMLNIYVLRGTSEVRLVNNVNSRYHDASAILTKDGRTLYFTRDNFDGKKLKTDHNRTAHLKIYRSRLKNGIWTPPKALPFNSDKYSIGHPALSTDESELYFVSDMPGGYGQTDIYKVTIGAGGSFGSPVNLGSTINTEGREMFPFVYNKQLFFASDGHLGLGLLDVFEAKIEKGSYGEPENIGVPFNSSKDDFAFFISERTGYFSSNRAGGRGDDDIYSFEIKPCRETIKGVAYNSKDQSVMPETLVKLINEEGIVLATTTTDKKGRYSFTQVECNRRYILTGNKKGFTSDSVTVSTQNISELVIESELFLSPMIVDNQIVINPIFFDFDKSNIRPDAEYELEKVVTVMQQFPEIVIRIESHTDSRGDRDYNRKLSDRRAKSSRDYIISRGVNASRIVSAIGYGEDKLLNKCDDVHASLCSEAQHQQNRRSYFFIVKGKDKVRSSND